MPSPESHSGLADTALRISAAANETRDALAFLRQALPIAAQSLQSDYVAVVHGQKGRWQIVGAVGHERSLPMELLFEALDRDESISRGEWHVRPLVPQSACGELLIVHRAHGLLAERG